MSTTTDTRFCSVCAQQAGLDPADHGVMAYKTIIAAELPLPWPESLFSDPARMPPEIIAVLQHMHDEYVRTHTVSVRPLGIAPDRDYSAPGMRRVIRWRRPDGPFAQFDRDEYLAPEARLGLLVYALALAPERLADFASHRQEPGDVRDLLVCTHGSIDAACSKFGYPTYAQLRRIAAQSGGRLRAWRTTHFGGHVFAPTLIDMLHGSYWAYIECDEAELLARRAGDAARLHGHYRGWAGLPPPFLQALDRDLFARFGWEWLGYAKAERLLTQDESAQPDEHGDADPAWAEVQLDYAASDGATGSVIASVESSIRVSWVVSRLPHSLKIHPTHRQHDHRNDQVGNGPCSGDELRGLLDHGDRDVCEHPPAPHLPQPDDTCDAENEVHEADRQQPGRLLG
jgi:hypothetical protein